MIRPKSVLTGSKIFRPDTFSTLPRDPKAIWLDKNENLDAEYALITQKVYDSIDPLTISTYPEASLAYEKLSSWLGVSPENLIFTPGSDGAIRMTFECFVEKNDPVIYTNPTFAMYSVYSKIFECLPIELDYIKSDSGPFLDIETIILAIEENKPKIFCLPNPDSPTGTILQESELLRILAKCESTGTIFLLDEAYHPYYDWTGVNLIEQSENLIIARTFSKAWGSAGIRVGYAVGQASTISVLHKIRSMYEVSSLATSYVSNLLDYKNEMTKSVLRLKEGKEYYRNELKNLGYNSLTSEGNFIHVDFREDAEKIHEILKNKVLYREDFDHPSLNGYSRFTVAPTDVMKKVIDLIKEGFNV